MAYRRSLTTSARLFARQRFAPALPYTRHEDDRKKPHSDADRKSFLQNRSYRCFGNNTNASLGFVGAGNGGVSFRDPRWSQFLHAPMTTSGFLSAKNMSTTNADVVEAEKTDDTTNMADALSDKAMEVVSTHTPIINEIAIATADSSPPVAFLQCAIGGIHNITGLNWWASILITTLLIRTFLLPFQINQLNASSKSTILKQEVEQITKKLEDKGMSPKSEAEYRERLKKVDKERIVSQFAPFKSMVIQGPVFISFFLAIQNMVEKVPSFQTGGISWFIDLTTSDNFYILPFLAAFSCLLNVECNSQEGLKSDPNAEKMKNISRGFAVLTLPLTASFPNALFFYWIPSNFFSIVYALIIKKPSVKKILNIPIIIQPPPSAASELKSTSPPLLSQKPNSDEHKLTSQRVTSSSVVSHRIKIIEKKLKGRKKNKKRNE